MNLGGRGGYRFKRGVELAALTGRHVWRRLLLADEAVERAPEAGPALRDVHPVPARVVQDRAGQDRVGSPQNPPKKT